MKTRLNLVIIAIILLGCGVVYYMNPALRSKVGDVFSGSKNNPPPVPEARKPEPPALPPPSVAEVVEKFLTPGIRQFAQSGGAPSDKYRAIASQLEHTRRGGRSPETESLLVDLAVRKMEEVKAISEAYIAVNHLLPPAGLKTNDVGFSHATLLWDMLPVPAISYEVWDGPPSAAGSNKLVVTREVPCRIESGLRPDTGYVFYVRAACAGNYSEASSITVQTKPVSLGPPANLGVMEATYDSITLRWDAFSLPGASYEIWNEPPSNTRSPIVTVSIANAAIKGLQQGTTYTYYVRTIWDDKVSKTANIRAKTELLPPPSDVLVAEAGVDFVTLKWNAIPVPDVYYEVLLSGFGTESKETTRGTTIRFDKLTLDTEYILSIRTVHKNTVSKSVPIKAKTKTFHDIIIGTWTYRWPGDSYDTLITFNSDGTFRAEWPYESGVAGGHFEQSVFRVAGASRSPRREPKVPVTFRDFSKCLGTFIEVFVARSPVATSVIASTIFSPKQVILGQIALPTRNRRQEATGTWTIQNDVLTIGTPRGSFYGKIRLLKSVSNQQIIGENISEAVGVISYQRGGEQVIFTRITNPGENPQPRTVSPRPRTR